MNAANNPHRPEGHPSLIRLGRGKARRLPGQGWVRYTRQFKNYLFFPDDVKPDTMIKCKK